jgi:hypothetical protein
MAYHHRQKLRHRSFERVWRAPADAVTVTLVLRWIHDRKPYQAQLPPRNCFQIRYSLAQALTDGRAR